MDQLDIVHLESYRGRREARYRRTLILHGREPVRSRVLELLWRAASVVGADRSAVVWLDEYGPGLVHPQTILDLATDRPRRFFSPTPLRTAWDTSVPGLLDIPQTRRRLGSAETGVASSCTISLGSDGPRSWFLVVDALTPRGPLTEEAAGELMFLAGEIAAVVLHRDLDFVSETRRPGKKREGGPGPAMGSEPFPGWTVLQDLEGRSGGDEASVRIGNRFLVARIVMGLVEDELVSDPGSLRQQLSSVRSAVGPPKPGDSERAVWERVFEALGSSDHAELTSSVLEWGRVVEGQGHLSGAQEIMSLAYDLARANGSTGQAADAARFLGKIFRTRAEWDQAMAWYTVARGIVEESGDHGKLAAVLDGLANAYRDRGNLPRAREVLHEVLEIGRKEGDRYATAIGSHDLMTVEKLSGDLYTAIRHGWLAVQSYDSRDGRLRALFDLSGVLRESGELSAARDGYLVVSDQVDGLEARVLCLDALAFVSALMGDQAQHDHYRTRLDREGWREVSPIYRGQILYFRGLSYRALGDEEKARTCLQEALAFAEDHGLNKLLFDAEGALEEGGRAQASPPVQSEVETPPPEEILGVRQGLRDMREALTGTSWPG